ncbi:GFA family protein [Sphingomonas crusticola]|uniref:GFA family protein n=1 Tax=Sphingomonas crusticola TaxID=1697973 RepID=UPI000E231A0A|nr:GFA family protein [Sphingomonas crusticola]
MTDSAPIEGGCLCGALRYVAYGAPLYAGLCYCADCRKASGSGFIPFLGFAANVITITGETRRSEVPSLRGGIATRNHCGHCGSLVFGGIAGESDSITIYAGSLDDPSSFQPQVALFVRDRPSWAEVRPGLQEFATMPD